MATGRGGAPSARGGRRPLRDGCFARRNIRLRPGLLGDAYFVRAAIRPDFGSAHWRCLRPQRSPQHRSGGPIPVSRRLSLSRGGCRTKPSEKMRSAPAEVHARASVRDDLATNACSRRTRWLISEPPLKAVQRPRRGLCDSLQEEQRRFASSGVPAAAQIRPEQRPDLDGQPDAACVGRGASVVRERLG